MIAFPFGFETFKKQEMASFNRKMKNNHNVGLHFSDSHVNYYTAWCYVAKSYKSKLQNVGHADLKDDNTPQTSNACQVNCCKRKNKSTVCVNKNKKS